MATASDFTTRQASFIQHKLLTDLFLGLEREPASKFIGENWELGTHEYVLIMSES